MKLVLVLGLMGGFLLGGLLGASLELWAGVRDRLTYAALIAEKDSLASEVELCRRSTRGLGARLAALETMQRGRR